MNQITVNVHLKNEILDPQGRAIFDLLRRQNLEEIIEVRQGKQFSLTIESEVTPELMKKIEDLAKNLLSNPVIEDYSIEVKNES